MNSRYHDVSVWRAAGSVVVMTMTSIESQHDSVRVPVLAGMRYNSSWGAIPQRDFFDYLTWMWCVVIDEKKVLRHPSIQNCVAGFGGRIILRAIYEDEKQNFLQASAKRDLRAIAYYGKRLDAAHKCWIAFEESEAEYPFSDFMELG
jgi:hypothetical protein